MVHSDSGDKVYNLDIKGRLHPRPPRNFRRPNGYNKKEPVHTEGKDVSVSPSDDEFFNVDEDEPGAPQNPQ